MSVFERSGTACILHLFSRRRMVPWRLCKARSAGSSFIGAAGWIFSGLPDCVLGMRLAACVRRFRFLRCSYRIPGTCFQPCFLLHSVLWFPFFWLWFFPGRSFCGLLFCGAPHWHLFGVCCMESSGRPVGSSVRFCCWRSFWWLPFFSFFGFGCCPDPGNARFMCCFCVSAVPRQWALSAIVWLCRFRHFW